MREPAGLDLAAQVAEGLVHPLGDRVRVESLLVLGDPLRAHDEADDVVVDHADDLHLAPDVEPEVGHRGERLVDVAQRVGARDRALPGAHGAGDPRMALEVGARGLRDRGQPLAPPAAQVGVVDELAGHDAVAHQVQQLVLAAHVVVQAHRPEPELGGDASHRDGIKAVGVGHGDGRLGDVLARARGAPPGRLWPHPDRLVGLGATATAAAAAALLAWLSGP
jgi:hypothetical protein